MPDRRPWPQEDPSQVASFIVECLDGSYEAIVGGWTLKMVKVNGRGPNVLLTVVAADGFAESFGLGGPGDNGPERTWRLVCLDGATFLGQVSDG